MIKWIGAAMIIFSCAAFGFSMAADYRREESTLRQLISALDFMQCELRYRLTPLPDLCREAAGQHRNMIGQVLLMLAQELECMISPDVEMCVLEAISGEQNLPPRTRQAFETLGSTLGRFDVDGQIQGLEGVRYFCKAELEALEEKREMILRNYKTLSICAGAALVILFV